MEFFLIGVLAGIFAGVVIGVLGFIIVCKLIDRHHEKTDNQNFYDDTSARLADMLERAKRGEKFEIRR